MNKISKWSDYYKTTSKNAPSKVLVKAVSFLKDTQSAERSPVSGADERPGHAVLGNDAIPHALELGAGTPRDSIFLLDNGFSVTAIDKEEEAGTLFKEILDGSANLKDKFEFIQSTFEDFEYVPNYYELISAQRALPFLTSKLLLSNCIDNIKSSLRAGGIFAGHFFGPHDTWCIEGKQMTFVDETEIRAMLVELEIIELDEKEEDSTTAKGTPHHWHIFSVIARKA